MNQKHKAEILQAKAKKAQEKVRLAREQENASVSAKVARILAALFYAVVSMTTSLPTLYALFIWLIAASLLVYVALDFISRLRPLAWYKKTVISAALSILLMAAAYKSIHKRYMAEKAAALGGELHAANPNAKAAILQIGKSHTQFSWDENHLPQALVKFAADNKFKLEVVNGEILVSTEIRDEYTNQIIEIDKNRWKIPRTAPIVDKNYTDDALEIRDRRGHVVFQMHLLSDRVEIQGEWHREWGGGTVLMEREDKSGGDVINIPSGLTGKDMFPWSQVNIEPMFDYPSDEHWAEWRKR